MKKFGGYFLLATGFLACPCHLLIILGLAAGLLGGTALGGFLTANIGVIILLSTAYFVGALVLGFNMMRSKTGAAVEACDACLPDAHVNLDSQVLRRAEPDSLLRSAAVAGGPS